MPKKENPDWLNEDTSGMTADEIVEAAEAAEEAVEVEHQHSQEGIDYTLKHEYQEFLKLHKGNLEEAMFHFCFVKNYFYDHQTLKLVLGARDNEIIDELPCNYLEAIKKNPGYNENLDFFSQIKRENFEKIYSEDLNLLALSDDDKKNRQQIISIIGYDPFVENPVEDRPQLYRDLTGMLTDNMRKDIPRAKAAVEVVMGYSNIKKYQTRANILINSGQLDDTTQKQLDKLLEMVSKIQKSVLDISEKNGFSNSRSVGSNGKGMLSDVMATIEEYNYDDGVANYYDIATSKSLQEVSDVSFNSMLKQVKLTGQDYSDMLMQQAKIVREAQKSARQANEARRIAMEKLTKQELIEELKAEYRKKGISEEDIEEFISREYHLWDGK